MKKGIFFGILCAAIFLLASCSHPEKADVSTKALVDSYIYQEDVPELQEIYGLDDTRIQKENENEFVTSVESELSGVEKEKITQLNQKFIAHLKKTTSYTVDVKKESNKEAVVSVNVKGLDLNDKAVQAKTDELVKNVESKITADSTDDEMKKLVNQTSFEMLEYIYLNSPAKKKETKVTLRLKRDEDNHEKWEIKNETEFFEKLYAAFGL
ncbi:DUF5105 domain-containing protein [Listeria aquatica]|uniref:DUF5105 domain-containing protein n=1 Tax=Listeria aquatica TaxID=1494960 RepID=A0A841ZT11_9LIST|nr:DUF5105 domain-containing protein [Listeria aquatica]MBC1522070.1 DUF5105 domain-containing protein [Listeria aquatica]